MGAALEPLLSTQELADYLGIPVATIYVWRSRNVGPPAVRVGKHLRFRHSDVAAWLERDIERLPR